ncbi:MAG: response regulator [Planctomycetota bacterium]
MKNILVVDDNREILDVVEYALRKEGFEVKCAEDGKTALDIQSSHNPNLIILDISMPGMDGRDVLKTLRKTSQVPVIFLSALGDEVERILGLEIGADDYIVKPFSHRELVARVRAVLRRSGATALGTTPSKDIIAYGPFRLDRAKFQMNYADEKVVFSRAEFKIVETLLRQPGRVFSRNQLLDAALGFDSVSTDRTIDTHMKRIRQKMKTVNRKFDAFETVRGVGYRLREIA